MTLIPARLQLVIAIGITALALLAPPGIGRAHGQMTAEEAMKLIQSLPPGTPVQIEQSSTSEKAAGDGPSGTAVGDNAKLGIDGTAPTAHLGSGAGAVGGSVKATGTASGSSPWFANPLFWLACLCELIALALWLGPKLLPLLSPAGAVASGLIPKIPPVAILGIAGAGGLLFLAVFAPVLATIGTVAAFGVLLGPKVLTLIQSARGDAQNNSLLTRSADELAARKSAFDELAEAVANDPAALDAVLAHLDAHADDEDEARIRAALKEASAKLSPASAKKTTA